MKLKLIPYRRFAATSLLTGLALAVSACTDSQLLESTATQETASVQGCVAATPLDTSRIKIDFEFPAGARKVALYRDGTLITTSSSPTKTSYVDTRLREGETYRYTCEVVFPDGVRPGKNVLRLSTLAFNAPIFDGISEANAASPRSVTVKWKPASSEGPAVAYYQIFAKAVSQSVSLDLEVDSPKTTVPIGQLETTIDGLGDELKYSFAVRACTRTHICSSKVDPATGKERIKTLTLPDAGAPATVGATLAVLKDAAAEITVPWTESQGAIAKRRIYLSLTGGTNIQNYTLIRTDLIADPLVVPGKVTVDNLAENTSYFFIVRDEDPSMGVSPNTSVVTIRTTDLTPPVFSGIDILQNVPLEGDASYPAPAAERKLLAKWTAITSQPADSNGASVYVVTVTSAPNEGTPEDPCSSLNPIQTIEIPAKNYVAGTQVTWALDSLQPRTTYSVCVKARDEALNVSKTTAYRTRTTKDQTPPVFNGITSNPEFNYGKLQVSWTPSSSSDIRNYRIRLWKGTPLDPTPIGGVIREFSVQHSDTPNNKFTFINDFLDPFYIQEGQTVYAVVDACDTASPTYHTRDNCTALTNARSVSISDISPPQNFLGIDPSNLVNVPQDSEPYLDCATSTKCQVEVKWLKGGMPGDWSDYAGFNIYLMQPGGICEKLSTASPCTCLGNVCPASCKAILKTAYKDISLAVTAYDRAGNETTCDGLTPTGSIRTLDQAPPVAPATSTPLSSVLDATGAKITWDRFTDNQYPLTPGIKITYEIYRKESLTVTDTFANLARPFDDPSALLSYSVEISDAGIASHTWTDLKSRLREGYYYHYTVCAKDTSDNRSCLGSSTYVLMEDATPPTASAITVTQYGGNPGSWRLQWSMSDNGTPAQSLTVKVWRKAALRKDFNPASPDPALWPDGSGVPDYTTSRLDSVLLPNLALPPKDQIYTVKLDKENDAAEPRSVSITQHRWINYLIEISDTRFNKKRIYASAFSGMVFTKANNDTAANLIDDTYVPDAILGASWILQPGAIVKIKRQNQLALNYLEMQGDLANGGSVLDLVGCTTTKCYKVDLNVTGDAIIDRYASINADEKGYLGGSAVGSDGSYNNSGSGRTNGNISSRTGGPAGGAHGGYPLWNGQYGEGGSPTVYGDLTQPLLPGGGGGGFSDGRHGGHGGGVIRLMVSGTLTLNGALKANGGTGSHNLSYSGSGAGGSIWIDAGVLQTTAGSPRITAKSGIHNTQTGGGGRIAIYYSSLSGFDFSSGTNTVEAFGRNGSGNSGGPGSIYYVNKTTSKATLRYDNDNNAYGWHTPILLSPGASLTLSELVVERGARVTQESFNYNIATEKLTIQTNGLLHIPSDFEPGTLGTCTSGMTGARKDWFSYTTPNGVTLGTNLVEYDAGRMLSLTIDAANLDTYKNRDWVISGGERVELKLNEQVPINSLEVRGILTHSGCTIAQCYKVDLNVTGDITVAPSGAVNADTKGYLGGYAIGSDGVPNTVTGRTNGNLPYAWGSKGGSHGGYGRYEYTAVYGDFTQPSLPGSGGSGANYDYTGGNGGGVIRLTTSGTMTLNGTLSANGGTAADATYGGSRTGGGAGGSIWIDAETLRSTAGTPLIRANGGNTNRGGGGGRIAIYYSTLSALTFSSGSTTQAIGGDYHGSPGSIYYRDKSTSKAYLRFDNNNLAQEQSTPIYPIPASGTIPLAELIIDRGAKVKQENFNYNLVVEKLTIQNGGTLNIPDNFDGSAVTVGTFVAGMTTASRNWFSYATSVGVTPGTNLVEYDAGIHSLLTIDSTNVGTYQNQPWVINGGEVVELRLNERIPIQSLDLKGTLTHTGCTTTQCYKVDLDIAGNATISSVGAINVDGKGYLGAYARGHDNIQNNSYAGRTEGNTTTGVGIASGSHGGRGAKQGTDVTTKPYGDFAQPDKPGGGGGENTAATGGNGGGVIRLALGGNLTVNGTISANGAKGNIYAGAGGSIWIDTQGLGTTGGTPQIRANGASPGYVGAGGGRVALYYTSLSGIDPGSRSMVQAFGAAGSNGSGGAGSIYYKNKSSNTTTLRFDNNNVAPQAVTELAPHLTSGTVSLDALIIDGRAAVKQEGLNYRLIVGTLTIQGSGSLTVPDNFDGSTATAGTLTSGMTGTTTTWFSYSSGSPGTGLTEYNAGPPAILTIDADNVGSYEGATKDWLINPGELVQIKVDRQIQIRSLEVRGTLTHLGCTTTQCYRVGLDIGGDATITSAGTINVDGQGYLGGYRIGSDGVMNNSANGRTFGNLTGANERSGGSHGGAGSIVTSGGAVVPAYGSFMEPSNPGGGGGGIAASNPGGNGGGVVRLAITGRLVLDGIISANGTQGNTLNWSSPGAGGSIWINASSLERASGTPLIRANGSNIGTFGAGAGGRVALYYSSLSGIDPASSLVVQTFGGANGTYKGGAGTIYYKASADLRGNLRYDNNGFVSQYESPISLPGSAPIDLQNLILANGAKVKQTSNLYTISVTNSTTLTNGSTLSIPIWGANDGIYGAWFSPGALSVGTGCSAPEY